ncbi:hypothetical protein O181_059356 [Austropuccinia psidii MF-1]|uniref:DUF4939 domain-containing protein n=1 Tax=Austropuccinia psidii MF-1 TaxID=1389203 RepID=A0A9Q3HVL8_9BASI|nr:hypothetical protein [Austropuccinia psidii MF-1]
MPVQNSPPARQTRSQARNKSVLTKPPKVPLDGTSEVCQMRAHLDRGPVMEGEAPSRKEGRGPRRSSSFSGVVGRFQEVSRTTFKGPSEDGEEEEENSLEEEGSDGTESVSASAGGSQENDSDYCQSSRSLKTPSMVAQECIDGTQPFKLRSFIQSFQLIFHNDKENLSEDRKEALYSTSFLIGRAAKWIEPYISNLTNQDPAYLLNNRA